MLTLPSAAPLCSAMQGALSDACFSENKPSVDSLEFGTLKPEGTTEREDTSQSRLPVF